MQPKRFAEILRACEGDSHTRCGITWAEWATVSNLNRRRSFAWQGCVEARVYLALCTRAHLRVLARVPHLIASYGAHLHPSLLVSSVPLPKTCAAVLLLARPCAMYLPDKSSPVRWDPLHVSDSRAGKGRGLVATRPLQPGELVLVSQPVGVVFWDDGYAEQVMEDTLKDELALPSLPRAKVLLLRLTYDGTTGSGTDCPDLGGPAGGWMNSTRGLGQQRTAEEGCA